jgi:hypothetical protein
MEVFIIKTGQGLEFGILSTDYMNLTQLHAVVYDTCTCLQG